MLYTEFTGEDTLIVLMGTVTLFGLGLSCWLKYHDKPQR